MRYGLLILGLLCAQVRGQEARARELAAASADVLKRDSTLALLLAREAFAAADVAAARTAIYAALMHARERAILRGHEAAVVCSDLSPDAQTLATASDDGTARIWTSAGQPVAVLATGAPAREVRFLGADRVLTATDKALAIWDRAGSKLAEFPAAPYEVTAGGVLTFPAPGQVRFVGADGKVVRELAAEHAGVAAGARAFFAITADGRVRLYDRRGRAQVLASLAGTTRAVFAASGNLVATFGSDTAVELWSPKGKKTATLRHGGPLEQVSVSPAGDRVLTASADGYYAFWRADGRRLQRARKPGPALFAALADRERISVTFDDGNRVTLWTDKGRELASKRFDARIRRVEPNSEGAGLVLEFQDGTHRFVDLELNEVKVGNLLRGELTFERWGNDGNWLFVGDDKGRAALQHWYGVGWAYLDGHTDSVLHARFSAGDRFVLTASRDRTARLWEIDPPGTTVLYHSSGVDGVGYYSDQRRLLAYAWTQAQFRQLDGRLIRAVTLPGPIIWWGFGGKRVAAACRDEPVAWLFDLDGKEIARLRHDGPVTGVHVSWKGNRVVTFSRADRTARLWDTRGKLRGILKHPRGVIAGAFSFDGRLVLTMTDDGRGRIWSARGKLRKEFYVPEPVWYCFFSPTGDRLVTVPVEQPVPRVWTPAGEEVAALRGHEGRVWGAAFPWEGDAIVTTSADKTARLWDKDGRPGPVLAHPDEVLMGIFLPRGQGVVTACKDGSVRHWDRDGRLRAVMKGHVSAVWRLDCTKEGDWLATASEDTTLRLWPLGRASLLRIAQERLCRDFTPEERARYAKLLAK
ncbi:MAG: WD40 repeat domain-containing protein [Planctomycetota bacterium]